MKTSGNLSAPHLGVDLSCHCPEGKGEPPSFPGRMRVFTWGEGGVIYILFRNMTCGTRMPCNSLPCTSSTHDSTNVRHTSLLGACWWSADHFERASYHIGKANSCWSKGSDIYSLIMHNPPKQFAKNRCCMLPRYHIYFKYQLHQIDSFFTSINLHGRCCQVSREETFGASELFQVNDKCSFCRDFWKLLIIVRRIVSYRERVTEMSTCPRFR